MTKTKMPVVFIGHGSPMNAIEDNQFTKNWEALAKRLPEPKAILVISAHWYTEKTRIQTNEKPEMIYDMYGFPKELYDVIYPAKGAPVLAKKTQELISTKTYLDSSWGYDHGTWSVLRRMFPKADIPVFQISVDANAPAEMHFEIGENLKMLRDQGVLILGSGNVVHNLRQIDWHLPGGYPLAQEFDNQIKMAILEKRFEDVVNYKQYHEAAMLSVPTPDHFYPLLYVLGAAFSEDTVEVFNDSCLMGSMSMTCYALGM